MQELPPEQPSPADSPWRGCAIELCCWPIWGGLLAASALRSLRFPHDYARTHWLFHYGHGFVKRGLPGQLIRPFVLGKTPDEVRAIIDWVAALLVFGTGVSILWFATWSMRRCLSLGPQISVALATALVAASPFAFNLANLAGYFDHLLVIATLASVTCVMSERPAFAGVFALLAALSHEMFALFGLPVVLFASLSTRGNLWRTTLLAVAPCVAGLAFVGVAEQLGTNSGRALHEELLSMRLLPEVWVEWGFHSMQHSAHENFMEQSPRFLGWLVEPVALEAIHPTTLVMTALGIAVLVIAHRLRGTTTTRILWWSIASLVVVAAPSVTAAMGWDWPRFFAMSQFHAYVLVAVAALRWEGSIREAHPSASTTVPSRSWRSVFAAIAISGVAVTAIQWRANLPRVASGDESDNPFALRMNSHYTCRELLFRNSDFSSGRLAPWRRVGPTRAFDQQPLLGELGAARGQPVRPSHEWIGTFVPHGDSATGTLTSPDFQISASRVAFRLGGTPQSDTYVRLILVDGQEVHRATPRREDMRRVMWNTESLVGSTAVIEIVDNSQDGHLNVERFCYPRLSGRGGTP